MVISTSTVETRSGQGRTKTKTKTKQGKAISTKVCAARGIGPSTVLARTSKPCVCSKTLRQSCVCSWRLNPGVRVCACACVVLQPLLPFFLLPPFQQQHEHAKSIAWHVNLTCEHSMRPWHSNMARAWQEHGKTHGNNTMACTFQMRQHHSAKW